MVREGVLRHESGIQGAPGRAAGNFTGNGTDSGIAFRIDRPAFFERDPAQQALRARYEQLAQSTAGADGNAASSADCTVVLVRGLFGAWIPHHFAAPLARMRSLGWDAHIARTDPAGTIAANREALVPQIARIVADGRRPLFLAHSKGGLELLLALAGEPALMAATAGVATVQMPRAGAPYLESVFSAAHRESRNARDTLRESIDGLVLRMAGARAACSELNGASIGSIAAALDGVSWPFPWLAVATHSALPTRSLELKHARLDRIAPGVPHDGVFYTADQFWPKASTLLLTGIDHAQPSVGGGGFAHDRFWCALPALLTATAANAAVVP